MKISLTRVERESTAEPQRPGLLFLFGRRKKKEGTQISLCLASCASFSSLVSGASLKKAGGRKGEKERGRRRRRGAEVKAPLIDPCQSGNVNFNKPLKSTLEN